MPSVRAAATALVGLSLAGCAQASISVAAHDSPTPSSSASAPSSPTSSELAFDPHLQTALDRVPLPPGSVRLQAAAVPSQPGISVSNSPAKVTAVGYWKSPLSRLATMSWLAAHLPPTWTGGGLGTAGGTTSMADYDRRSSPSLEGPNYTFSVEDMAGGASVVVTAWEIPLVAKSAKQQVSEATTVTLSTKDPIAASSVAPLQVVTLNGAQAARLAADVNALTVDDGSPSSCTEGTPDVVLNFSTPTGQQQFLYDRDCRDVTLIPKSGPALSPSPDLYADVDAALKSGPGPTRGTLIVSITTPASHGAGAAGTVTIQRGSTTATEQVADGRIMLVTEPPGVYTVTAASGTLTCTPTSATVVVNEQVDAEITCR